MALANFAFTVTPYQFIGMVANYISLGRDSVYTKLSADGSDAGAIAECARIVNRKQHELMGYSRILNKTTAEIDLVSTTNEVDLPDTVFRTAETDIQFYDDDDQAQFVRIEYISPETFRRLGPAWLKDDFPSEYPKFYTVNPDLTKVIFAPYPSTDKTLLLSYRATPDPVESDDLTDPDSDYRFIVPDDYIDVLVLMVACEICIFLGMIERRAFLMNELGSPRKKFTADGRETRMHSMISQLGAVESGTANSRTYYITDPQNAGAYTPLGGIGGSIT